MDTFILWAVGTCASISLGLTIGAGKTTSEWHTITVERGLAQYCQTTGDWAWKGECDE